MDPIQFLPLADRGTWVLVGTKPGAEMISHQPPDLKHALWVFPEDFAYLSVKMPMGKLTESLEEVTVLGSSVPQEAMQRHRNHTLGKRTDSP